MLVYLFSNLNTFIRSKARHSILLFNRFSPRHGWNIADLALTHFHTFIYSYTIYEHSKPHFLLTLKGLEE